ncbi:hypothetical protein N6H18_05060 [Reichenbachiella agarivorans]|uniref:Uncharacterized protein n=1 Tax=Reichenbachiella agarivorans TaxID=2979464 RepID=A0ABY6CSK5_9BACT|nr:hypothetical protein [Reichenbachiella agarivorans]UXP33319.1 hypothetical protein N6H18_05060 [Reichenbachiella agarivorans]
MTKISFELWGLDLLEPMGFILNMVMCLICVILYMRLRNQQSSDFTRYWINFFWLFAVSTFFGGFSHLLFNYLGMLGKIPGWLAAVLAISSIEMAVATQYPDRLITLKNAIRVKAVLALLLLSVDLQFTWVMIHTAIGLLIILGAASIHLIKMGESQFSFFLYGIAAMILTLPFRLGQIDPHLWFNRDDVSHLLMMLTLVLFYKGVKYTELTLRPAI